MKSDSTRGSAARRIQVLVDCCVFAEARQGGIARYFREVLPRVAARHTDIEFLLLTHGREPPLHGPGFRRFSASRLRPGRVFRRLNDALDRRQWRNASVFHSTYYTDPPIPAIPRVVTVYDMIDEHFFDRMSGNHAGFRLRLRQQIDRADHVIAISAATSNDVLQFTGKSPDQVSVCHLAVDNFFRKRVSSDELVSFQRRHRTGADYILYVGHRWGYKNFGVLLEGWCAYRDRTGSQVKLICVGPPTLLDGHHVDFVIRHRLAEQLVVLANLSEDELRCAYQGAKLFVFPSLCEGFGLPILEAAAASVPLVLSDIPAFREVAGDVAIYFDKYDPLALADALAKASRSDVATEMHRRTSRLPDKFSWDAAADLHAEIYRKLAT